MENFDIKSVDTNNFEFQNALSLIKDTQQSLFLTGKAGTGKSTFLKYICATTSKKHVVLAPTGVAAVNVGGVTMHSFFKIPFRPILPDDEDLKGSKIFEFLKYSKEKQKIIQETELIIIDEISMVRADIIDFIDRVLRVFSHNMRQPFGGKQILFVGDMFQLEPVVPGDERQILSHFYPNNYFFSANVFKNMSLVTIELQKVYRQKDDLFISILDKIRINRVEQSDLAFLNQRYTEETELSKLNFVITVATKKDVVDYINESRLNEIEKEPHTYKGLIEGDFPESSLPTSKELVLKEGAQVIFVKNDPDKRWYNGSIGIVSRINELNHIFITLENGEEYEIEQDIWNNIRYKYDEVKHKITEEMLGSFKQFPIRLAWAITVHKSQGLTFDNVIVDLSGGVFAGGQTYVALSRCRSLNGLYLKKKISLTEIFVNQHILKFASQYNNQQLIDKALKQSKADVLYASANISFRKRDFKTMLDTLILAMHSRYDIEKPEVRRLIQIKLSEISVLEEKLSRLENLEKEREQQLSTLAKEFILMGDECREKIKNNEAAIANYKKAILLNPNNCEYLVKTSQLLITNKDLNSAEELLTKAIQIEPEYYEALFLRGKLKFQQNKIAEAVDDLEKASSLKPKQKRVHKLLYEAYLIQGNHTQAMIHLKLSKGNNED